MDGISFVTVATGLFAVGEVHSNIGGENQNRDPFRVPSRLRDLFPTWRDLIDCKGAFVRAR
jgi:TctA family transporter